ncbi:MAG: TIGR01620 family protein [Xanthobacteraceae bacterium]|nr:TIGR01620 family protein [Xanthobacteraceae bacterium]
MTTPRKPATFKLDDPHVVVLSGEDEAARPARGTVQVRPEPEPALPTVAPDQALAPMRPGLPWGLLFWTSLGGLVLLALGLGVSNLVEDLFNRSQGLGFVGAGFAALFVVALIAIIAREIIGLSRLATIERLHARAADALIGDDRPAAEAIVRELSAIARGNPRLAHARAMLQSHSRDIIDGADLLKLAERELMSPLDAEARRLVSTAAQRVSIVTAVSPRALVDMLFVFAAAARLIRQLARLYGGRPGALGLIKLTRQVIAHLAITGGVAASDSLIQQMLGHGIAAKLSSRLGEGLLNGLLTARLGLATIDVTRPLPFTALPRPALSDLAGDLLRKREQNDESGA